MTATPGRNARTAGLSGGPNTSVIIGTLQSFDPRSYTASVLPDGATATFLNQVAVAANISASLMRTGARVSLLMFDRNNPQDAMVIGVAASGSPAMATSQQAVACRVYRSTSQSIPNNTQTALSFDTSRFDTLANAGLAPMWSAANDAKTVYVRQPGIYLATAHVEFATNANGERTVGIFEVPTNAFYGIDERAPVAADTTNVTVTSGMVQLAGGNGGFQVFVFQNSGGALNVDADPAVSPELSVVQLGSG